MPPSGRMVSLHISTNSRPKVRLPRQSFIFLSSPSPSLPFWRGRSRACVHFARVDPGVTSLPLFARATSSKAARPLLSCVLPRNAVSTLPSALPPFLPPRPRTWPCHLGLSPLPTAPSTVRHHESRLKPFNSTFVQTQWIITIGYADITPIFRPVTN